MDGLKAVLFAFWFRLEDTVAFIFLTVLGATLGLVKFEDFMIGLLGNPNFARLASSGDILTVVVSSGTVSVVEDASVEGVVGTSVVACVVESKSMIGLELGVLSVVVVVVGVDEEIVVDVVEEGETVVLSVCGNTEILNIGFFSVASSTAEPPLNSWPLAKVVMLRPDSGFKGVILTMLASSSWFGTDAEYTTNG